jgi:cation:H+ antiporter
MFLAVVIFLAGLATLLWGSDKLVDSAVEIARRRGLSTFFIGVTVISVGTSVPEIAITAISAFNRAGDLVVGNIMGSEIAQITLAVGIVALISPITGERDNVMLYGGGMIAAMVIMLFALSGTGIISMHEGLLMMLTYVFFLYLMYHSAGGAEVVEGIDVQQSEHVYLFLLAGLVAVPLGAHFMVDAGIEIAEILGVPQFLIGMLTGLGTTIPEIAVAGLAAYRQTHGISAGSLLGSNITDPLFSIGMAGFVADVAVTNLAGVMQTGFYMVAVSTFVVGVFAWKERVDRRMGFVCVLLYIPALLFL